MSVSQRYRLRCAATRCRSLLFSVSERDAEENRGHPTHSFDAPLRPAGSEGARPADPAWPIVLDWAAEAVNPHRVLEAEDADGEAALAALEGVTEWSVLGALARNCAALVVDDWLLVLGAGGAGYPGLRDFNGPDAPDPLSGNLIQLGTIAG